MSKAETAFGLGTVVFGGVWLEESMKLAYFVEEVPGPGFLPFWTSLGIIALGLVLVVRGARSIGIHPGEVQWPSLSGWGRIGLVMIGLGLAIRFLNQLGFFVVVTLYLAVATYGLGGRSWRELLPIPVLAAVVLYGIFAVWLKVPLPKGILNFLG